MYTPIAQAKSFFYTGSKKHAFLGVFCDICKKIQFKYPLTKNAPKNTPENDPGQRVFWGRLIGKSAQIPGQRPFGPAQ